MTSVGRIKHGERGAADNLSWYLTVLGEQSRLALLHLTRLWAIEGDPPDPTVWIQARRSDVVEMIWAEIQGALFAGIVVSRILDPRAVRGNSELQLRAHERGDALRTLLSVADDSALLSVGEVRDAFEHLDERMDRVVHAGDVVSVSDLAINWGGCFESLRPGEADGRGGMRHVNMRAFAPDAGYLIYDDKRLDLWAWEVELHNLLIEIRDVHKAQPARDRRAPYGAAKPMHWSPDEVAARQERIHEIRALLHSEGDWMPRPSSRPETVDLVINDPPE